MSEFDWLINEGSFESAPQPVSKEKLDYIWRDITIERQELHDLIETWNSVSKDKKPKSIVLLANTGFGKTKLVQSFYENIHSSYDEKEQYYPKKLDSNNHSLSISPSISDINYSANMPYLWWGVRIPDQTNRNSQCSSFFSSEPKIQLARHITTELYKKDRYGDSLVKSIKGVGDIALSLVESLSGIDLARSVFEGSLDVLTGLKEVFDNIDKDANKKLGETEEKIKFEDKELVLELISKYMKLTDKKPIIWLIDDAQWIDCDPLLLEVLEVVMNRAIEESWPILFLMTHWNNEWDELEKQNKAVPAIVNKFIINKIIKLGLFDLSPILDKALPNIKLEHKKRIIGHINDGKQEENDVLYDNPRCLDEFLKEIYDGKDIYLKGSINNQLVENWEDIFLKEKGALGLGCAELAKNRFRNLDYRLKNLLAWSSYNGINFPEKLVEAISKIAKYDKCDWHTCEISEGFISRDIESERIISAFQDSKYRNIAYDFLDGSDSVHRQFDKKVLEKLVKQLLSNWLTINKFYQNDVVELVLTRSEEVLICKIAIRLFSNSNNEIDIEMELRALIKLMNLADSKNNYENILLSIDLLKNKLLNENNIIQNPDGSLFVNAIRKIVSIEGMPTRGFDFMISQYLENIIELLFNESGYTVIQNNLGTSIGVDLVIRNHHSSRFLIEIKYLRLSGMDIPKYFKTRYGKLSIERLNKHIEDNDTHIIYCFFIELPSDVSITKKSGLVLYNASTSVYSRADSDKCEQDIFGVSTESSKIFTSVYKKNIFPLIQMLIALSRYKENQKKVTE